MNQLEKLVKDPKVKGKLIGLSVVALVGLGFGVTESLVSSLAPKPIDGFAWDQALRDAPASGIQIRKPAGSLTRPLGLFESDYRSKLSEGTVRTRDASPLLAGAGPLGVGRRSTAGGYGGSSQERDRDSKETALAPKSGTLQKSSLGSVLGGGSSSGGSAGLDLSGSKGGRSLNAAPPSPVGAGSAEGFVKNLGRKAAALLPQGLKKVAASIGGALGQAITGTTRGASGETGFATGQGSAVSGQGSTNLLGGEGSLAASQAGNVAAGGLGTGGVTGLGVTPTIKDVRDITPPAKEDEDEDEDENGEGGGGDAMFPETALGRCIGGRSRNARCRAYRCAADDASDIASLLRSPYDAASTSLIRMLNDIKVETVARIDVIRTRERQLASFNKTCRGCEKLNECARTAHQRLYNVAVVMEGQNANIDLTLRDLAATGRTDLAKAQSWKQLAYLAASHEEALLKEHYPPILQKIGEFTTSCVSGIPENITVGIGADERTIPEPAGVEARKAFEELVSGASTEQQKIANDLKLPWCQRQGGGCPAPDMASAQRRLDEHFDTLNVFEDYLRAGDGEKLRQAKKALDVARWDLPRGSVGRSQPIFEGVYQLWLAALHADEGARDWSSRGQYSCRVD